MSELHALEEWRQNLAQSTDLLKAQGWADGHMPIPKSWFVDPNSMLSQIGFGWRLEPTRVTFDTHRNIAMKDSVIAGIIQTRLNQMAAFCQPQRNEYSVGFKAQHVNHKYHRYTQRDREHAHKLERFVMNCGCDDNPGRDDFETFVRKFMRDSLIMDQGTFEKTFRWSNLPHSFAAVDASTFRFKSLPEGDRGVPIDRHAYETQEMYVQLLDGEIHEYYTPKELAFLVRNPRTDLMVNGYGLPEGEMLITTITSHLFAEKWNQSVFSQGSTVKGLLNMKGNIPPHRFDEFKRMWMTQVSGVSNAWRTPVLNAEEVQWIPVQPSNTDMGYEQWLNYLIKVECMIYQIDPAEINFDMRAGTGQQPMFMSNNEAQQKISKDRGLQPLLRFLFKAINRHIISQLDPEWELVPAGLDAKTEEQAIDLDQKAANTYLTINEIRAHHGLAPVEHGDVVANPTYIGYLNQVMSQEAQQQQAGQPGQPGQPPQGGAPGQGPPSGPLAQLLAAKMGKAGAGGGNGAPGGAGGPQPALPGGRPPSPFQGKPGAEPDTESANAAHAIEGAAESRSASSSRSSRFQRVPEEWEDTMHASLKHETIFKSLAPRTPRRKQLALPAIRALRPRDRT